jgi:hypothetical protein
MRGTARVPAWEGIEMAKRIYSREELIADHDYAKPQVEAGYRLHGGFDSKGAYISPRTLNRWPAVHAWQQALKDRGHDVIDASVHLLKRGPYPTAEQQKFLLNAGDGESLWNGLTITGIVEARGAMLATVSAPNFQNIVVEDLSETCLGHLNKGLLEAHGWDEGGTKSKGIGGHDDMWFAVRDALFGKNAYPIPPVPDSLARPETGRRMPQIPKEYEDWILLLMNVLMIEVRAENFFSFCIEVMRDPANFRDRRAAADHAAELVSRIRTDEAIHVGYLQTIVSELRSFTIKTVDGKQVPGRTIIDPVWEQMIEWHAVTNADFTRVQSRDNVVERLRKHPHGEALVAQFDALELEQAA